MPILQWISSLFSPAVEIVKNLHTSDADRMALENALAKIKADVESKMIDLEKEKVKLQEVEANSPHIITAIWRPVCSVVIVGIILAASFDIAHPNEKFYELAQWFLVGFVGGRSLEKSAGVVGDVINKVIKR